VGLYYMKTFEITTPDGRIIRHRHQSLEEAQKAILRGYEITGEVLGASADGLGGLVDPVGPGTVSIMETLLESRGDVLLGWLAKRGIG
jgi:hypothetical protein